MDIEDFFSAVINAQNRTVETRIQAVRDLYEDVRRRFPPSSAAEAAALDEEMERKIERVRQGAVLA